MTYIEKPKKRRALTKKELNGPPTFPTEWMYGGIEVKVRTKRDELTVQQTTILLTMMDAAMGMGDVPEGCDSLDD